MSPAAHIRLPSLLVLAIAALWLAWGCGGAQKAAHAPHPPNTDRPADPATLPILLEPAAPEAWTPFLVNPTMAVAARPGVQLAPVADDTAWQRARRALDRGALPAARPEAFVDAVAEDGPGPLLRAEWAPSPYRPGYHGLRLVIAPPAGPPPAAAAVVLEARRDLLDAADRAALRALPEQIPIPLGLVVAAERARWIVRPGEGSPAQWAAAVDALDLAGPAHVERAVTVALDALPAEGLTVVIADPRARWTTDHRRARAAAPATLAEAIRRRPWLSGARMTVDFDDRHVERYRLVGFDGGGRGGRASTLWAGRPTAVLFEIKLRQGRPPGALGRMRLRGVDGSGRRVEHVAPLSPTDDADGRVAVAMLAAAAAEKLRAAWWVRGVDWPRLSDDARALRGAPGVERLLPVVARAAALDRRPDRFAGHGPARGMDPDVVPVLRRAP